MIFLILHTVELQCEMEATTSWLAPFKCNLSLCKGVVTGASLSSLNVL